MTTVKNLKRNSALEYITFCEQNYSQLPNFCISQTSNFGQKSKFWLNIYEFIKQKFIK